MVEVFKTNVCDPAVVMTLIEKLQCAKSYKVNFDLADTDRILRVQSIEESINADLIIELLNDFGFEAEVLPN